MSHCGKKRLQNSQIIIENNTSPSRRHSFQGLSLLNTKAQLVMLHKIITDSKRARIHKCQIRKFPLHIIIVLVD